MGSRELLMFWPTPANPLELFDRPLAPDRGMPILPPSHVLLRTL